MKSRWSPRRTTPEPETSTTCENNMAIHLLLTKLNTNPTRAPTSCCCFCSVCGGARRGGYGGARYENAPSFLVKVSFAECVASGLEVDGELNGAGRGWGCWSWRSALGV